MKKSISHSGRIVSRLVLCILLAQTDSCSKSDRDGVLDSSIYSERYIDSAIRPGMSRAEVESGLGMPYRTDTFMETVRAQYLLDIKPKAGDNFLGFFVVYKNDIVTSVDKMYGSW